MRYGSRPYRAFLRAYLPAAHVLCTVFYGTVPYNANGTTRKLSWFLVHDDSSPSPYACLGQGRAPIARRFSASKRCFLHDQTSLLPRGMKLLLIIDILDARRCPSKIHTWYCICSLLRLCVQLFHLLWPCGLLVGIMVELVAKGNKHYYSYCNTTTRTGRVWVVDTKLSTVSVLRVKPNPGTRDYPNISACPKLTTVDNPSLSRQPDMKHLSPPEFRDNPKPHYI